MRYTEQEMMCKRLPDGRAVFIDHLTFGRARLSVGPPDAIWYDDGW